MPAQYTVAPFQKGVDTPADIAALHLEIRRWQEATGQNTFMDIMASQKDLNVLDRYYIAPGGNFFIAKDAKGKTIGFLGLRNDGDGHVVFKRLAVVPEWHRKGVARALVTEAMEWVRQHGFTQLNLQTNINEHAKPLYEDFGFKVIGWVEEEEDWLMECRL